MKISYIAKASDGEVITSYDLNTASAEVEELAEALESMRADMSSEYSEETHELRIDGELTDVRIAIPEIIKAYPHPAELMIELHGNYDFPDELFPELNDVLKSLVSKADCSDEAENLISGIADEIDDSECENLSDFSKMVRDALCDGEYLATINTNQAVVEEAFSVVEKLMEKVS